MAVEPTRVDYDEFADNLGSIFDRVKLEGRPVIVNRAGELYRLEPQPPSHEELWAHYDADLVREALAASAGALRGVDRDKLLADIHAQRAQESHGRRGN